MGRITEVFYGQTSPGQHIYIWVCPAGVFSIDTWGIGAGGPGGNGSASGGAGGGGAGAAFARKLALSVIPGTPYNVLVGGQQTAGSDGSDSEFNDGVTVFMRAKGGQKASNGPTGAAGTGSSTGCIGDDVFAGGNGAAGASAAGGGGGAGGTGGVGHNASGTTFGAANPPYGGRGGTGVGSGTGTGGPGDIAGGGGGGGRNTGGGGGVGKFGAVWIEYDIADSTAAEGTAAASGCDSFTGGDDPDIDGRVFDGCGGGGSQPSWADDGSYNGGAKLAIASGAVTGDTARETQATVIGPGCPSEGPTHFQGGRLHALFPNYDVVSTPETCTLIWEDDFSGPSGALAGRVHSGGSAGTGTYKRTDSHATSSPSGAQLDGSGAVYTPDHNMIAGYQIMGLTLPASYDVIIDVERVGAIPNNGVGATLRGQDPDPPTAGLHGRKNYGLTFAPNDGNGHPSDVSLGWSGWVNDTPSANIGSLITGFGPDGGPNDNAPNTGETRPYRYSVRSGSPYMWAYPGDNLLATPCDAADWHTPTGVVDGQFGSTLLGTAAGRVGLRFNVVGGTTAGVDGNIRIRRVRIYSYTPAVSGYYFTDGYPYINLRANPAAGTGYQVALEGVTLSGGVFDLSVWIYDLGNSTYLRFPGISLPASIPRTQTDALEFTAWIEDDAVTGHPTIYAAVNGIVVKRFDLVSDIADATADVLGGGLYTDTGLQLGVYDSTNEADAQPSVQVLRFEPLCIGAAGCVPCVTGSALQATDSFSGGDVSDIDGRAMDGGAYVAIVGGHGTYAKIAGDAIGIVSGVAVQVAAGSPAQTLYAASDLTLDPRHHALRLPFSVDHLTATASEIIVATHLLPNGDRYQIRLSISSTSTVYYLEKVIAGVPTALLTWDAAVDPVPAIGAGPHILSLCAECDGDTGTALIATIDGSQLNLGTGFLDDDIPTGTAGIGLLDQDAGASPRSLSIGRVDLIGCGSGAPGGGGGGPGGGGQMVSGLFQKKNGVWRPVPIADFNVRKNLAARPAIDPGGAAMRWNLDWRFPVQIVDPGDDSHGDPGDAIPDSACGSVPSSIVPPATLGSGFFFCYDLPVEGAAGPFNAAFRSLGSWSTSELTILASRNMRLATGNGGYGKFLVGGTYSPSVMNAYVASHGGYLPGMIANPHYLAHIDFDDYRTARWGTGAGGVGVSGYEVNRVAGLWKSTYAGIRIWLRDTPQKALDWALSGAGAEGVVGATLPNIDGFITQYWSTFGPVTVWRDMNIARAGGKDIIWSLNWTDPNGVGTGAEVTADWILRNGMPLADELYSIGLGGWDFDPHAFGLPGVMDAITTLQNRVAIVLP